MMKMFENSTCLLIFITLNAIHESQYLETFKLSKSSSSQKSSKIYLYFPQEDLVRLSEMFVDREISKMHMISEIHINTVFF